MVFMGIHGGPSRYAVCPSAGLSTYAPSQRAWLYNTSRALLI